MSSTIITTFALNSEGKYVEDKTYVLPAVQPRPMSRPTRPMGIIGYDDTKHLKNIQMAREEVIDSLKQVNSIYPNKCFRVVIPPFDDPALIEPFKQDAIAAAPTLMLLFEQGTW